MLVVYFFNYAYCTCIHLICSQTPLHYAAIRNHHSIALTLLKCGATAQLADKFGMSIHVIYDFDVPVMSVLIQCVCNDVIPESFQPCTTSLFHWDMCICYVFSLIYAVLQIAIIIQWPFTLFSFIRLLDIQWYANNRSQNIFTLHISNFVTHFLQSDSQFYISIKTCYQYKGKNIGWTLPLCGSQIQSTRGKKCPKKCLFQVGMDL